MCARVCTTPTMHSHANAFITHAHTCVDTHAHNTRARAHDTHIPLTRARAHNTHVHTRQTRAHSHLCTHVHMTHMYTYNTHVHTRARACVTTHMDILTCVHTHNGPCHSGLQERYGNLAFKPGLLQQGSRKPSPCMCAIGTLAPVPKLLPLSHNRHPCASIGHNGSCQR